VKIRRRKKHLEERKNETIVLVLSKEWVLYVAGKGVGKRSDIY